VCVVTNTSIILRIVKYTLSNAVLLFETQTFLSGNSVKGVKINALREATEVHTIYAADSIKNS
jgi:hypothetical protein